MTKKIFIILLLSLSILLGQEQKLDKIDSLRTEHKYQLLLNPKLNNNLPLFSLGETIDPYQMPFEYSSGYSASINYSDLSSIQNNILKNNINQSFVIYRKGQNKYDLGVVSDVLGYVNAAAAAGLAAYHVYKYRKKYGLK